MYYFPTQRQIFIQLRTNHQFIEVVPLPLIGNIKLRKLQTLLPYLSGVRVMQLVDAVCKLLLDIVAGKATFERGELLAHLGFQSAFNKSFPSG